jgi:hypothetical protein
MIGIDREQRVHFCRATPLRQRHGLVRMGFIQLDEIEQISAMLGDGFPYGIRKR